MEPTNVALIGLLSGMVGALLVEALKHAYQRRPARPQAEEAKLESLPESAPQAGAKSLGDPRGAPVPAVPPTPPAPPVPPAPPMPPTPATGVSWEPGESEVTRAGARVSLPVNPAIDERDLKPIPASPTPPSLPAPTGSGAPAGGNGNSRKRTPVMLYLQDSSILATVENSDEVEAILQASRGKPGARRKTPKAPPSRPEPVEAGPAPVPLPEVRPTLEEEAAARPAGIPFWLMCVLLGVSILLALVFLFLALQPILGF